MIDWDIMQKILFSAIAMALLLMSANATSTYFSPNSVSALLMSYNVSSSVIGSLTPVAVNYSGTTYVILYQGTSPKFVVNTSHTYSIVLSQNTIFAVIKNYTINQVLQSTNFTALGQQMDKYKASSAKPLLDCQQETGITQNTCTLANTCQSCQFVPVCKKVMSATGGPSGSFGLGIMILESQSANLSAAYAQFSSSVSGINSTNAAPKISGINSAFNNISSITLIIGNSSLFPPPSSANFGLCRGVGSSSTNIPTGGPWYCNAVGFCQSLTYNYTLLSNIQSTISTVDSLPIGNTSINNLASSVISYEGQYIAPILAAQKGKIFAGILNSSLPNYAVLVNNSAALLTHINNATLSAKLTTLTTNYTYANSNYATLNLTARGANLTKQYNALSTTYSSASSVYKNLLSQSANNTALITTIQLNSEGSSSKQLNDLAFQQAQLNSKLQGKVTNASGIESQLMAISSQVKSLSVFSLPNPVIEFMRGIDGPFVRAFSSQSNTYAGNVSGAPFTATLLSLIIGIIIIVLCAGGFMYLRMSKRLRLNPRAMKNWMGVFVILVVIIIIYLVITFWLASIANSEAPLTAYNNFVRSSSNFAIVVNGTVTPAMQNCTAQIKSTMSLKGKSVVVAYINSGKCTTPSGLQTSDQCLNAYASKNIPVLMLSNANDSGIEVYSFYGTMLRVHGNNQFMTACTASSLSG